MNQIANDDDDDDVFDYEYDAYGIVDPLSMGIKGSTIHEIGLAAADKERARLQEIALEKARAEAAKRQAEAEAEAVREQELDRRKRDSDNDGVPDYVEDSGGSYDGGYHGAEGGFENTGGGGFSTSKEDKAGTSEGSGQFSPSSDRGRSGY